MSKTRLKRRDFIWTADLAYAIGLITTDGCLSSDHRHIDLTSKDLEQIKRFNKILKLKNKVGTKTNGTRKGVFYRVQFSDVVFYDWLIKIGLSPHKSLTLNKININMDYFRDFLRGNLDGDGNITYYIDRYNTYLNPSYVYERLSVRFVSGSEKYLNWLRKCIVKNIKIKGSISKNIYQLKKNQNQNYCLKFSTKEAKVLLNWIYYKENLPCLRRKFIIAKPFLNFV